jgi:hypothetical protein
MASASLLFSWHFFFVSRERDIYYLLHKVGVQYKRRGTPRLLRNQTDLDRKLYWLSILPMLDHTYLFHEFPTIEFQRINISLPNGDID